jgi:uncharacterized protein (TIGR02246 family)
MKADAGTEAGVLAALSAYAACYARRDVQGVLALHAPDPDVIVFVGGFKFVGLEQIRALVEGDLAAFDALAWAIAAPSVSAAGVVAWVAADATVTGQTGGQVVPLGAYRLTWVLERRCERWLIVHAHLSAAAREVGGGSLRGRG